MVVLWLFMEVFMGRVEWSFENIAVGDWIVWLRNDRFQAQEVWNISKVKLKEKRGEDMFITVAHPEMQRFNFGYYFSKGQVRLIEKFRNFS